MDAIEKTVLFSDFFLHKRKKLGGKYFERDRLSCLLSGNDNYLVLPVVKELKKRAVKRLI